MNTKMALVLALVFGFIAAIAVRSWLNEEGLRQRAAAEPLGILSAGKRLAKGGVLKAEDCKMLLVPKNLIATGMIPYSERYRFTERVLNREIDANKPIFEDFLENVNKTDSLARLAVQPDRRAVTLQVDQVSGVAGLIRPGDYVDVIGTFIDENDKTRRITKTVYLLQAGRVMAIDNKVIAGDAGQNTSRGGYRTVTLEVRPEDALRLISASHTGSLQLILRNPSEGRLIEGIEEIKESGGAVSRQKATDYWDVSQELKDVKNSR